VPQVIVILSEAKDLLFARVAGDLKALSGNPRFNRLPENTAQVQKRVPFFNV
jgi:hypothetical protein